MATTIYSALVQGYAMGIYMNGTRRFTTILPDYIEPTKQFAAANYTLFQIDNALAKGYISQQEYAETIALASSEKSL